jgi:hypothetical protein
MLLGDQMTKNEMDGACGKYRGEERRGVYRVLLGKPEGKRQFEGLRHRGEESIKMKI